MNCICKDWKENLPKLNSPFMMAISHPHIVKEYDGKIFVYCPWCGRKLKEEL